MADPKAQLATQLANIQKSTGKSIAEFSAVVQAAGLEKHGQIMALFKSDYGLTHGNANTLAHVVREALAGGPAPSDDLLAAQYAGGKAGLLPIYERLAAVATGLGADVEQVVQKTGVSFRRKKQFALVQAPSAKRVQLGLNLPETPADARVKAVTGMCSHRVDLTDLDQLDAAVGAWLRAAYEAAG